MQHNLPGVILEREERMKFLLTAAAAATSIIAKPGQILEDPVHSILDKDCDNHEAMQTTSGNVPVSPSSTVLHENLQVVLSASEVYHENNNETQHSHLISTQNENDGDAIALDLEAAAAEEPSSHPSLRDEGKLDAIRPPKRKDGFFRRIRRSMRVLKQTPEVGGASVVPQEDPTVTQEDTTVTQEDPTVTQEDPTVTSAGTVGSASTDAVSIEDAETSFHLPMEKRWPFTSEEDQSLDGGKPSSRKHLSRTRGQSTRDRPRGSRKRGHRSTTRGQSCPSPRSASWNVPVSQSSTVLHENLQVVLSASEVHHENNNETQHSHLISTQNENDGDAIALDLEAAAAEEPSSNPSLRSTTFLSTEEEPADRRVATPVFVGSTPAAYTKRSTTFLSTEEEPADRRVATPVFVGSTPAAYTKRINTFRSTEEEPADRRVATHVSVGSTPAAYTKRLAREAMKRLEFEGGAPDHAKVWESLVKPYFKTLPAYNDLAVAAYGGGTEKSAKDALSEWICPSFLLDLSRAGIDLLSKDADRAVNEYPALLNKQLGILRQKMIDQRSKAGDSAVKADPEILNKQPETLHTGERPSQTFAQPAKNHTRTVEQAVRTHKLTHTGKKEYKCQYCGRIFGAKCHMESHEQSAIHNNERPFQCDYCSKRFIRKSHREAHERRHTGEKPFECKFCSRKFGDPSAARRHEKNPRLKDCKRQPPTR